MRIFCSICKDIFIPYSEVHVTNCGHVYHGSCISTWIKQHRTCPQCRSSLSKPFRVYFDVDKDSEADPSALEHQIEILSDKLRNKEKENKNLIDENETLIKINIELKEYSNSLTKRNETLKTSTRGLKDQVIKLLKQHDAVSRLENELEALKIKVSNFERIEMLIKGSADDVNKMIESTPVTGLAVKQLCTYVGVLKSQLQKMETKNVFLAKENRDLQKSVLEEKQKYSTKSEELIKSLRESNSRLENELLNVQLSFKNYKKKHPKKMEESLSTETVNISKAGDTKSLFDISLEMFDKEENQSTLSLKSQSTIDHWEELVCAGPSKRFNLPLKNSRSFTKSISSGEEDFSRSSTEFAYDGLGGRKKLRLGGPTPLEEFEKIKKKKDKKLAPAFQHKKIFEYCQLD